MRVLMAVVVLLSACASEEEQALVELRDQIVEVGGFDVPDGLSVDFRSETFNCGTTSTISQRLFTRNEADQHPVGHPLETAAPIAELVASTADRIELYEAHFEGVLVDRYIVWTTETSTNFIIFTGDVGLEYRFVDYSPGGDCVIGLSQIDGADLVEQFTE